MRTADRSPLPKLPPGPVAIGPRAGGVLDPLAVFAPHPFVVDAFDCDFLTSTVIDELEQAWIEPHTDILFFEMDVDGTIGRSVANNLYSRHGWCGLTVHGPDKVRVAGVLCDARC